MRETKKKRFGIAAHRHVAVQVPPDTDSSGKPYIVVEPTGRAKKAEKDIKTQAGGTTPKGTKVPKK